MKRKFKRVYHHYLRCEEYSSPMWRVVDDKDSAISGSAELMIDRARFEAACMRVITEWPNSAEAALTASVINHQAWIGHAACALNHGAPEDLTRLAWRSLNQEQQDLANAAADRAIEAWGDRYARSKAAASK